jgi:hypothetical protein
MAGRIAIIHKLQNHIDIEICNDLNKRFSDSDIDIDNTDDAFSDTSYSKQIGFNDTLGFSKEMLDDRFLLYDGALQIYWEHNNKEYIIMFNEIVFTSDNWDFIKQKVDEILGPKANPASTV